MAAMGIPMAMPMFFTPMTGALMPTSTALVPTGKGRRG